jgi:Ca2+-transporting ATPase
MIHDNTSEMLKALSAVSLDNSLLTIPPWRNSWLLAGVALPFALHLIALYFPPMAKLFGLHPLTAEQWFYLTCGYSAYDSLI